MKKSLVDDAAHFRATHERWLQKVNRDTSRSDAPDEWFIKQCLSCAYYIPLVGAFAEDWGVCSNARSVQDGKATFEHDGCEHWEEAEEMWHDLEHRTGWIGTKIEYLRR